MGLPAQVKISYEAEQIEISKVRFNLILRCAEKYLAETELKYGETATMEETKKQIREIKKVIGVT